MKYFVLFFSLINLGQASADVAVKGKLMLGICNQSQDYMGAESRTCKGTDDVVSFEWSSLENCKLGKCDSPAITEICSSEYKSCFSFILYVDGLDNSTGSGRLSVESKDSNHPNRQNILSLKLPDLTKIESLMIESPEFKVNEDVVLRPMMLIEEIRK